MDSIDLADVQRRRTAFFITLMVLPVALLVYRLTASSAFLLVWCGAYMATALLYIFARCPRCGHLFHSVYPNHNPLSSSCRGCGVSVSSRAGGV